MEMLSFSLCMAEKKCDVKSRRRSRDTKRVKIGLHLIHPILVMLYSISYSKGVADINRFNLNRATKLMNSRINLISWLQNYKYKDMSTYEEL